MHAIAFLAISAFLTRFCAIHKAVKEQMILIIALLIFNKLAEIFVFFCFQIEDT